MKKITIITYSAFLLIMVINIAFYKSLYNNQVEYSVELLEKQVRTVGSEVDTTSMSLISDLTDINLSNDLPLFFSDKAVNERIKEKVKLYYSKYKEIIVSMMLYNNAGDVYTLFKDEERNSWLDGSYKAQTQPEIAERERIEPDRDKFKYYLPVLSDGKVTGNFVITIDITRYFSAILSKFFLDGHQWQWLINDEGNVIFDNQKGIVSYSQMKKIRDNLTEGKSGRLIHNMDTGAESDGILSSYYPVTFLGMNYGLVFSQPTEFYRKYILRDALLMGLLTLAVILSVFIFYRVQFKRQKQKFKATKASENTLVTIID
ncbi:MAG: cache domain-containing protein, partial [Bacteroidales bacterium]|nr:cache domain-containing protein [Bacteroidales bacterium]